MTRLFTIALAVLFFAAPVVSTPAVAKDPKGSEKALEKANEHSALKTDKDAMKAEKKAKKQAKKDMKKNKQEALNKADKKADKKGKHHQMAPAAGKKGKPTDAGDKDDSSLPLGGQ